MKCTPPPGSGSSPLARGLPVIRSWSCSARKDHPRSRGVYWPSRISKRTRTGSSPLARGLLAVADFETDADGIIPARAGFTPLSWSPGRETRDHPHSRGVYSTTAATPTVPAGSSPLARGLRRARIPAPQFPRIIPARAGFTNCQDWHSITIMDHPRSRGVYRLPRTELPRLAWIIPARAGFTNGLALFYFDAEDHPRSRGVYRVSRWRRGMGVGSSPLARGLRPRVGQGRVGGRDHPRSRGVYALAGQPSAARVGSSPLARGLHDPVEQGGDGGLDHPRSRGVYGQVGVVDSRAQGSSPLARGLPSRARSATRRCRIIPARAGFTTPNDPSAWSRSDHPRSRGVYTCT